MILFLLSSGIIVNPMPSFNCPVIVLWTFKSHCDIYGIPNDRHRDTVDLPWARVRVANEGVKKAQRIRHAKSRRSLQTVAVCISKRRTQKPRIAIATTPVKIADRYPEGTVSAQSQPHKISQPSHDPEVNGSMA